MSTLSEIYFNYNKAINQASTLESIAAKLYNTADSQMQNTLNSLSNAWKSDSSSDYLQKGKKVQTDISTSAKNLRKVASTIREVAQIVRNAELDAWRIANERK